MENTFWTLIDNEYYRVHNQVLKHAPINKETNLIETSKKSIVKVIKPEELELINKTLGCHFLMDDF